MQIILSFFDKVNYLLSSLKVKDHQSKAITKFKQIKSGILTVSSLNYYCLIKY